ncbi:hypothetical protein RZN05_02355 [Sphingomonas sp. HF-S4]|uniref:Lipocalin-like domain-containing protein n=1 Tax=Sphingomonas agrestis TaxID=3080540 RepID=A0ABU3Y366_9SPHN|nr:hypothetical protein [Sphingomonas sp. HF-S4]MDV3455811.1 hypothetical protein [Sphingomonas sp. HF-S4]
MRITGTWRVYVSPGFGEDVEWDGLPTIRFADGCITLEDGSHPAFVTNARGLRFSMPSGSENPGQQVATLLIDRGSDGFLQGRRVLADKPVGRFPVDADAFADGRCTAVRLIREDKLPGFREEQQGFAAVQRAILEDREPGTSPPTRH